MIGVRINPDLKIRALASAEYGLPLRKQDVPGRMMTRLPEHKVDRGGVYRAGEKIVWRRTNEPGLYVWPLGQSFG
jgi:hypothetical protein